MGEVHKLRQGGYMKPPKTRTKIHKPTRPHKSGKKKKQEAEELYSERKMVDALYCGKCFKYLLDCTCPHE